MLVVTHSVVALMQENGMRVAEGKQVILGERISSWKEQVSLGKNKSGRGLAPAFQTAGASPLPDLFFPNLFFPNLFFPNCSSLLSLFFSITRSSHLLVFSPIYYLFSYSNTLLCPYEYCKHSPVDVRQEEVYTPAPVERRGEDERNPN
jgi:hypothetical protein